MKNSLELNAQAPLCMKALVKKTGRKRYFIEYDINLLPIDRGHMCIQKQGKQTCHIELNVHLIL